MRRRAVLGAVVAVAGLLAVPSAAAAPPERTAWWSAVSGPGLAVPQPTTAEGDLRVARGTDVLAFAAVLYRAEGSTSGMLRLPVRQGRTTGTPDVVACPTVDLAWEEGGNQPMDKAPAYDCTLGMAFGLLSADGATLDIGLDATQQLEPGVWSLALVPNPESSPPFAVELQAPPDDAFTADPPTGTSSFDGADILSEPESAPAAGDSAATELPFSPTVELPADPGGTAAALSPLLADSAPLGDVAGGGGGEGELPLVAAEEPTAASVPARSVAASEQAGGGARRVLALLVLIAVCAAAGHAAGQQRPGPRLLGGRARALAAATGAAALPAAGAAGQEPLLGRHERPRGIGRFARTREAPPRGLR